MRSFFSFITKKRIPNKADLTTLSTTRDVSWGISVALIATVALVALSGLAALSRHYSVRVPARGGTIEYGTIGAPRFINPFFATNETEQLLDTLIFEGLVSINPDGTVAPVLADTVTVSPDQRELQATLKNDLIFSNGAPVTSADVAYAITLRTKIETEQNAQSPWAFVTVETPDEHTVVVRSTTGVPASTFATQGVVPKALWEPIPYDAIKNSTLQLAPIGTGPYKLGHISYKHTVPESVVLKRNSHNQRTRPLSDKIRVSIYANQLALASALKSGNIETTDALDPLYIDTDLKRSFETAIVPSTQRVALYSRTPEAATLLQAVSPLIDRNQIIATIENGYGIPVSDTATTRTLGGLEHLGYKQDTNGALIKAGTQAHVSIALRKDDALIRTATLLSDTLTSLGIATVVRVFDPGAFQDAVASQSFPILLERTDTSIPGYSQSVVVYQRALVHIHPSSYLVPPVTTSMTRQLYESTIPAWAHETDRVWQWFTK